MTDKLILVTGATGSQGGAVARALLAAGHRVRALTRHPKSTAAEALSALGAEVVMGDWDRAADLRAAASGATAVFSVQRPDADGSDAERRHGYALIDAAIAAGVPQFVHTSVCEAGRHLDFARWDSGYWYRKYWTDKWDIEERVRAANFARWTILKPAFLMDNFIEPKAERMFPHLRERKLVTAFASTTRLQLIAADDIAAFAAAAVADPMSFDRCSIDLAAEALTMTEIATILSRVSGVEISAVHLSPNEAKQAGLFPGWIRSQEWTNEIGYRADIAALAHFAIALTSFERWIAQHTQHLPFALGDRP